MARRALLVASTGGHLEQLTRLLPRLTPAFDEVAFASFNDQQSRSLLAPYKAHYVERIPPRGWRQSLRAAPRAVDLLRTGRFTDIISTGSAIAVPFLGAATLRGARTHYIESAARSQGPSLSGRIVSHLPRVHLYTQYASWSDSAWRHEGSVFDPFVMVEKPSPVASAGRVVVTLGTMKRYPFRRAVEAVQQVLERVARPDVEVLWQVGDTPVDDLGIDSFELIPAHELKTAIREADLVFAHAGIGSCLQILDSGRVPVLLPRRRVHGEHIDDHQLLIADELDGRKLAISRDPSVLTAADAIESMGRSVTLTKLPMPFALAT